MKYSLDTFRGDLFGGITSTVVALPVALGFGIASGMGAAAGAAARTLNSLHSLRSIPEDRIVETREDARRLAERILREEDAGAG